MAEETKKVAVVEYVGTLDDGTMFDTTDGKDPIEFPLGANAVIPGFEEAVLSLEPGGSTEITLPPEKAYGERDERLTQEVPRDAVPAQIEVKEGVVLALKAPNGQIIPARIMKADDAKVTIDLNHPLAGKTLHFRLTLKEIKDASSD
ncbi:peptidylprolyl isomerase [Candidatus Woesearchaeota archaeon]|nr:peptidylprolyl isomerase [Candidatus Woesearchaeota archaeon]